MCEWNLHNESVYFKELHNDQEYYSPKIYTAGVAVVSTITYNCVAISVTRVQIKFLKKAK